MVLLAIIFSSFLTLAQESPSSVDVYLGDFCIDESQIKTELVPIPLCQNNLTSEVNNANTETQITNLQNTLLNIGIFTGNSIDQKQEFCKNINDISQTKKEPFEFLTTDDEGKPWKLRFYFGFSRTYYQPTDMKLESSRVNVTIKDFEFEERTSSEFYNPANWKEFQDAFRWIDEPTNTFRISLEKNNNEFFVSIYHPKF